MARGVKDHRFLQAAAQYLTMRGYEIVELNYRRSRFIIDIIARKSGAIYFVTVAATVGEKSYDRMAASAVNHLKLAAAGWIEDERYDGPIHYQLLELDSDLLAVVNYIEDYI